MREKRITSHPLRAARRARAQARLENRTLCTDPTCRLAGTTHHQGKGKREKGCSFTGQGVLK